MEILLDDYKRRLETALNLLGTTSNNGGINDTKKLERIRTKISCYRTFIAELEREMANDKQSESNFAIPVVINCATCKHVNLSKYAKPCITCTLYCNHTVK